MSESFPLNYYRPALAGFVSTGKNESRAIIENYTYLFAVKSTGMPIEMDCGKAVFSFVPYPWLSALLLFIVLIAQAILKKDSMDSVMGYMPAISMLNYFFEAPRSRILLFVDFQN